MAVPDVTKLTLTELQTLIANANIQYKLGEAAIKSDAELRKVTVANSIATLDSLLGPVGSTPNLGSIRGVLAYSDADMAANAGLAFRLAFQGMEILTKTTLDLAHLTAANL